MGKSLDGTWPYESNKKIEKLKNRRGKGGRGGFDNSNLQSFKFKVLGSNCNGLKGKMESLLSVIKRLDYPACIMLQETKLNFPGTIQLEGYQVFERIRKSQGGGGLLTAVRSNLHPVLITSGSDETEILSVQVEVAGQNIRILNGYGPQEVAQAQRTSDEQNQIINKFWYELKVEVIDSFDNDCWILIEMDKMRKLGRK